MDTIDPRVRALRELCESQRFVEAAQLVEDFGSGGASDAGAVAALMEMAWACELRGDAEASVRCYRLAFDLSGGGTGLLTVNGDELVTKIRNLRQLQLDQLVDADRFEEAVALHEATRHVLGAGPLRAHDIVAAPSLAGRSGVTFAELRPARMMAEPVVRFTVPPPPLESERGDLMAPAQYLALIERARAFPRSNVVVAEGRVVYDLAAHSRRDAVHVPDGNLPDRVMTAAFGSTRALVEEPVESVRVAAGLCMFGGQSRNYGHWLCEFVPRMLVYNDRRCPEGIPLCIDDHMPATHAEAMALLDARGRPVLRLPPRPIEFGLLGLAPVPAFFPFDMKPGRRVYDTIWPADIMGALSAGILDGARERGALGGRTGCRLFVSRKAFTQRQLTNEAEIADALRSRGFEVICPETMTFLDQVDAFHSAEIVVGSCSSALTNGLFCRPGCQILGLINANLGFNFRGYASGIQAGGAAITFLRGETVQQTGHPFHASYTVPVTEVLAAVDHLVPQPPAAKARRTIFGRIIETLSFGSRAAR